MPWAVLFSSERYVSMGRLTSPRGEHCLTRLPLLPYGSKIQPGMSGFVSVSSEGAQNWSRGCPVVGQSVGGACHCWLLLSEKETSVQSAVFWSGPHVQRPTSKCKAPQSLALAFMLLKLHLAFTKHIVFIETYLVTISLGFGLWSNDHTDAHLEIQFAIQLNKATLCPF